MTRRGRDGFVGPERYASEEDDDDYARIGLDDLDIPYSELRRAEDSDPFWYEHMEHADEDESDDGEDDDGDEAPGSDPQDADDHWSRDEHDRQYWDDLFERAFARLRKLGVDTDPSAR